MIRIRFIAACMAFCFAAIIFAGSVWITIAPHEFDRRVEWVQLKIQALLPQPPPPEFVPTPLVLEEPVDTPTLLPNPPKPTSAATRSRAAASASTTATSCDSGSTAYFCAWKRPRYPTPITAVRTFCMVHGSKR